MTKFRLPQTALAVLLPLTLATGRIAAQSTPAVPAQTAEEEETIVLSPFVVKTEKDRGYLATNSTSGTRLDTPIKEIPLNIEVITNQFIQDTGATNLRESLRYSAGLVLESQSDAFAEPDFDPQSGGANDPRGSTRKAGESSYKLRGFNSDQVLRDGFRRQYSTDSITMDRVEVLRGPSALLYGVGSVGGVVNYIPKRPLATPKYMTGVTVGTNDLYRAEFDFTGPLGSGSWKPAYRITGALQRRGDHTEFYRRDSFAISPSFSFRPFKYTEVLIENEFGSMDERGVGSQNIRSGLNAAASKTANWLTDISPWINPRTFRWTGPDTYLKGPYRNHIIDVTQRISDDLFIRVGVGHSAATFDSRQVTDTSAIRDAFAITDPRFYYGGYPITVNGVNKEFRDHLADTPANSQARLDFARTRPSGSAWADRLFGFVASDPVRNQVVPGPPTTSPTAALRYRWRDYNRDETRNQARADINYKLDFGNWGKHNFVAGVQYMEVESKEDEYSQGYSYTGNFIPDELRYSYRNPTDYSPFRFGIRTDRLADKPMEHLYHYVKKSWDAGYFGVYQGQFWKDRITLIGGLRYDRSDASEVQNFIWEKGRAPNITSRNAGLVANDAPHATSPQAGLSFKINRALTVFGVYSTGLIPNQGSYDGNGVLFSPTKAKNYEAGIKFDALNGKISGTVSAFKIEREGTPRFLWWAPSPNSSKVKGWDPAKPNSTPWVDMGPESLWYAMKNAGGAAVAKQIFPTAFHNTLDQIAALPSDAANPARVNQSAINALFANNEWWSGGIVNQVTGARGLVVDAKANMNSGNFASGLYTPLVNFSDPAIEAFVLSAKQNSGYWGGNFFYTAGQTYAFGNGTTSRANAPDGSGAHVPLNDEATGFDGQIILTPTSNLQVTMNFSRLDREVTSPTYTFVSAPYWAFGQWYAQDNSFGTLSSSRTVAQAYANPRDVTTYRAPLPEYGRSVDDSPKYAGSLWLRYSLARFESLKGLTVGGGGNWEDKRLWYTGFIGGGGNFDTVTINGQRTYVELWTKERYVLNTFVQYKTKLADKYNATFQLNVDNLLDDQSRYGQVFAPGVSYRFSARLDF